MIDYAKVTSASARGEAMRPYAPPLEAMRSAAPEPGSDRLVNAMSLLGTIAKMPVYSHDVMGEGFYQLMLSVPRLSGICDTLPVTASERVLATLNLAPEFALRITGQVRSYNKIIEGVGRLLVTAFAQQLSVPSQDENPNLVMLTGALCKPPAYRTTPFGREIADLMLAVNRPFGKSDYIPCIAWGRNARFAARLAVGERIAVQGRLQSRPYQKQLPNGAVLEKVAYEVSVGRMELFREGASPAPASISPLREEVE